MRTMILVLILGQFTLANTPQEEGLRVAKITNEANDGFVGEYAEMEMVLINAHGDKTVRKLITQVKEKEGDGDMSISTFQWPADVKGTKMLTWSHKTGDDDQWLYLPALKRVKRISSRNKSGAFMGSEFSYEDLGSQEVEEFTYRLLGETDLDGRAVWQLERTPVSKKSGYSKEIVWMDKEYNNPLKIEYYDRKGELLKVGLFKDYKAYGKYWRANFLEMENVQTQKRSTITWSIRELGKAYDNSEFASDYLAD